MDGIGYFQIEDEGKLRQWLNDPCGPKRVAYHVGTLPQDRLHSVDLDKRALAALEAAEGERPSVHLTQQAAWAGGWIYLATKSLPSMRAA